MDAARFAERRAAFVERIDGLAVIPAAVEQRRNADVHHPFRQDSDFYFLTGFPEPDAVAVFDPLGDERYVLFVRPRDPEREAWDGRRAGVVGAVEDYGADAAYTLDRLEGFLRDRLRGHDTLWYRLGGRLDDRLRRVLAAARSHANRSGVVVPSRIADPSSILHEMRLVKSPSELAAMRRACELTAEGHAEAMRLAGPGMSEREIQGVLDHVFRAGGSPRDAYPPIVASGPNACILHYVENDRIMEPGDLLLIDAGAEYDYLAADITRTFPVDGRFTGPQRLLYDLVLAAHDAVLAICEPGTSFETLHRVAVRTLTEGMVDLGLLPGPVDDAVERGWYREFYFHGTSHWLGMDVHDAGSYAVDGESRRLVPGMTFTVEPGIYVAPDKRRLELPVLDYDPDAVRDLAYLEGPEVASRRIAERRAAADHVHHEVPEAFSGIGIRIEDDVLITPSGHENLTVDVPVSPAEVEALCAEAPRFGRRA
ncbi:MAG TPA: M24 family metallopeptidase [Actinobacteria bacterium]|nr:M24 family metallopeptidase [Actinomycetota bacterium]